MRQRGHMLVMLAVLSVHASGGCGRREEIKTYLVPKPDIAYRNNHAPPSDRTLAAIVLRDKTGWFFKISGENEPVNSLAAGFQEFIRGLEFSEQGNDPPRWKTPPGWTEEPGTGMRHATFQIESSADKPLEMSVIPLPVATGNQESYLLSNINRWRNELGLAPVGPQQLSTVIEGVTVAGADAWLMNEAGRLQANSTRSPPFASMNQRGGSRASNVSLSDTEITYDVPPGWDAGQKEISRGGISIRFDAAFVVAEANQHVEVTVSKFPARMANPLRNINRWRGQIGLARIEAADLDEQLESIVIGDSEAHRIEMTSPDDTEPRETITAVIVQHPDFVWFIKLRGDADLAGREQAHFDEFVKSIRFSAKAT